MSGTGIGIISTSAGHVAAMTSVVDEDVDVIVSEGTPEMPKQYRRKLVDEGARNVRTWVDVGQPDG